MLARKDWIPPDPQEPSYEAAYSRADAWLKTLTLAAASALLVIAGVATLVL